MSECPLCESGFYCEVHDQTPENVEEPTEFGDEPWWDDELTPENVECQTCEDNPRRADPINGGWWMCPDCTPENVEGLT